MRNELEKIRHKKRRKIIEFFTCSSGIFLIWEIFLTISKKDLLVKIRMNGREV
jgi:hypothetical protein